MQSPVVREKQHHQIFENVGTWNGLAKLRQKGLEVHLGTLLRMETDFVMMRMASPRDFPGDDVVGLRLSHPLGR